MTIPEPELELELDELLPAPELELEPDDPLPEPELELEPDDPLPDQEAGDWKKFVCVEPVTDWPGGGEPLAPGESRSLTAAIQAQMLDAPQ